MPYTSAKSKKNLFIIFLKLVITICFTWPVAIGLAIYMPLIPSFLLASIISIVFILMWKVPHTSTVRGE